MVLCVVFGCGSRSDRDKGIGFYRIPSVVTNKGEFEEELTTERREKWIKAISRDDTESKGVLNSERVCGKHFVSGKPAPSWHIKARRGLGAHIATWQEKLSPYIKP